MQQLGQDGRYRPVRRIDAGGIGEVWEADDTRVGFPAYQGAPPADRPYTLV